MTIIHLTGMSGTGKSTLLHELARRGWTTIDTDDGDWMTTDAAGERVWNEAHMNRLLASPLADAHLAIAGTVANQGRFRDRIDAVILLTAPLAVMRDRIALRTTNPYGKSPGEWAAIRTHTATVLPLLRAAADVALDTSALTVAQLADRIEDWLLAHTQ